LRDLGAALRDALQGLQLEPLELRWTHPKIEVAKLKQSSDVRAKAAEIRKQIGHLEEGPEEVLLAEKEPNELTHKASAGLRPAIRAHGRGRRSASSSKQLASPRDFWNSPDQQPPRQMMTLNEIQALITSGENESKYLEFKESRALPEKTTNRFREELSKDVSSFANSAGGKIIYGVAENPLRLDAFDRKLCPLERLQNLILTTQIKNNAAKCRPCRPGQEP
jgi:hypothetical protein